jgi:hypothetical protein
LTHWCALRTDADGPITRPYLTKEDAMRRSLAVVLLPALVAVQGCPPDHAPPGECTNWTLSNPHTITITNPGLDTLLVVRGSSLADTVRAQSSVCLMVRYDTVRAQ